MYLRARWYDAGSGVFVQRDPFAGFAERPYSLHPYQYGYANPARWTDPSGRCVPGVEEDCVLIPECAVWEPGCRPLRPDELNWEDGRPWGGAAVDFTPLLGDAKGIAEVFTGCDLVTNESLGWWRWAGIVGVSELRHLRHADDAADLMRWADAARDSARIGSNTVGEAWWIKNGGEILDPSDPRYPQSSYPVRQQPDGDTCMPTCAGMAGVANNVVTELEHIARSNQPPGLNFPELQTELAPLGWNVTIPDEMASSQALPQIANEVSAGRPVILRVSGVSDGVVIDHAVLIRSIEPSGSDWIITVNDPATGKVVLLDRVARAKVLSGGLVQYAVLSR